MFLRQGFIRAVLGVLKCVPDGLLCLGPPCGSFVWLNLATSLRTQQRPFGNEDLNYVELGSTLLRLEICMELDPHVFYKNISSAFMTLRLLARSLLLALLATVRGVYVILEQPQSSRMGFYPDMVHVGNAVSKLLGRSSWNHHFLWGPQ